MACVHLHHEAFCDYGVSAHDRNGVRDADALYGAGF